MSIPVIGFAGWSGSGKTTLIEKLIPALAEKGIRCAVIKHDVHGLSSDETGKDSERFIHAGALSCTLICSALKTASDDADLTNPGITKNECDENYKELFSAIDSISNSVPRADIILVEGFKYAPLMRIGISRKESAKGFTGPFRDFAAIVTDEEIAEQCIPCFDPNDIKAITEFIMPIKDH